MYFDTRRLGVFTLTFPPACLSTLQLQLLLRFEFLASRVQSPLLWPSCSALASSSCGTRFIANLTASDVVPSASSSAYGLFKIPYNPRALNPTTQQLLVGSKVTAKNFWFAVDQHSCENASARWDEYLAAIDDERNTPNSSLHQNPFKPASSAHSSLCRTSHPRCTEGLVSGGEVLALDPLELFSPPTTCCLAPTGPESRVFPTEAVHASDPVVLANRATTQALVHTFSGCRYTGPKDQGEFPEHVPSSTPVTPALASSALLAAGPVRQPCMRHRLPGARPAAPCASGPVHTGSWGAGVEWNARPRAHVPIPNDAPNRHRASRYIVSCLGNPGMVGAEGYLAFPNLTGGLSAIVLRTVPPRNLLIGKCGIRQLGARQFEFMYVLRAWPTSASVAVLVAMWRGLCWRGPPPPRWCRWVACALVPNTHPNRHPAGAPARGHARFAHACQCHGRVRVRHMCPVFARLPVGLLPA